MVILKFNVYLFTLFVELFFDIGIFRMLPQSLEASLSGNYISYVGWEIYMRVCGDSSNQ